MSSFDGAEARVRFLPLLPRVAKASFSSSEDDESLSKPLRGRRLTMRCRKSEDYLVVRLFEVAKK